MKRIYAWEETKVNSLIDMLQNKPKPSKKRKATKKTSQPAAKKKPKKTQEATGSAKEAPPKEPPSFELGDSSSDPDESSEE